MNRWLSPVCITFILMSFSSCSDDTTTSPREPVETIIESSDYLNNRFFRLDLPPLTDPWGNSVFTIPDDPGRVPGEADKVVGDEFIWPSSIKVFRLITSGPAQPGDIQNVALYEDRTGRWDQPDGMPSQPGFDWTTSHTQLGQRWRPLDFDCVLDQNGHITAIDLQQQQDRSTVLSVIYTVVIDLDDPENSMSYKVGDRPGIDEDNRIDIEGVLYYRMKLLKPQLPEAYTFQYVQRNIYSLGQSNIDPQSFGLRIEFNQMSLPHPHLDTDNGDLDWFRIFGLDQRDSEGNSGPDGQVDKRDHFLFDFQEGLLKFPTYLTRPFDADSTEYKGYAQSEHFVFSRSALSANLIPEIYDSEINPNSYPQYNRWRIVATYLLPGG